MEVWSKGVWFFLFQCHLTDLILPHSRHYLIAGDDSRCDALASIGRFNSKCFSFRKLSPASQGALPQVEGVSYSHGGQPGPCSPSLGCFAASCRVCTRPWWQHVVVSHALLWWRVELELALSHRLAPAAVFAPCSSASTSCLASPSAQDTNTSSLAATALSTSPTGLLPSVK